MINLSVYGQIEKSECEHQKLNKHLKGKKENSPKKSQVKGYFHVEIK